MLIYIYKRDKKIKLIKFHLQNFTSDVLDMLIQELPQIMTKEHIIAQKICYNDVCRLIMKFINKNSKKILEMQNVHHTSKKVCSFFKRSYYIIVSSYLICHIVKLRVNFE